MAIRQREPSFADAHLIHLEHKTKSDDLFELIKDFRHIHLQHLLQPSKSGGHAAFFTKSGPSSRCQSQQPQPTKPCVCRDTHWISDCFYLVPGKRPQGWKPNASQQKNVDEALQNNRTRAWVEKVLEKHKDKDKSGNNQGTSQSSVSTAPGASSSDQTLSSTGFNTQASVGDTGASVCSSFSAATWQLEGSWILNNGSNIHVCNSTMLSRFTKTRDAGPSDTLTTGTQVIPIECFGTIQITIKAPTETGYATMTLLNVAYVSDFMTNLVCQSILAAKGVYFDGWKNHLHREGRPIGFVEPINGHYIMENNMSTSSVVATSSTVPVAESKTSFTTKIKPHKNIPGPAPSITETKDESETVTPTIEASVVPSSMDHDTQTSTTDAQMTNPTEIPLLEPPAQEAVHSEEVSSTLDTTHVWPQGVRLTRHFSAPDPTTVFSPNLLSLKGPHSKEFSAKSKILPGRHMDSFEPNTNGEQKIATSPIFFLGGCRRRKPDNRTQVYTLLCLRNSHSDQDQNWGSGVILRIGLGTQALYDCHHVPKWPERDLDLETRRSW